MSEMLDKLSETVGELCKEYGRQLLELRQERDQLRAELAAAKDRGDGLYLGLRQTLEALGGVAQPGVSEAFLILGVPGEAAALKRVNTALAADNARLREVLSEVAREEQLYCDIHDDLSCVICLQFLAKTALAAPPAQSLAAHDAAVKVAVLDQIKSRLYALASKEVDQPYGHDMNPRQWAATCLECAAEDVAAMQEEIQSEADRIEKEAQRG